MQYREITAQYWNRKLEIVIKMATRSKSRSNVNIEKNAESSESSGNGNDMCGLCESVVTEDEKAVACEICDRWYHIKCDDLPEAVYDFMASEKGRKKLSWYCSYCSRGSVKLYNRLQKLEVDQEEISIRQSALVEEVKDIKEGIDKKNSDLMTKQDSLEGAIMIVKETVAENKEHSKVVESRLGHMEATFIDLQQEFASVKEEIEKERKCEKSYSETLLAEMEKKTEEKCLEVKRDMEKDLVDKTTNHMQSRMERKNNVVLYGAPEEVKENLNLWLRSEKIKHDKAILLELCLDIDVECYVDDIMDIKRVGKFKKNKDRVDEEGAPRPIIVTLKEGIKEKVLRNVHKLKNTENEMLKRIRVSHDMTQDERQIDMELRLEARKKNETETGNFFYVVRGNPWERYMLQLKKKRTLKVSDGQLAQAQVEGERD